ncbi:MAG TPA: monovalent cation/H+ antiporter complex subunit F [Acidimicrobiales bacterium]
MVIVYVALGAAAVGFAYPLLRGPGLAERIVGFDGMLSVLVIGILANAVRTGSEAMLPVVLVLSLLAFSSTALLGRFIEAGDDDR